MKNNFLIELKRLFKRELVVLWLVSLLLNFLLIGLWAINRLPLHTGDFVFFSILIFLAALYRPRWIFFIFISTISLENIIFSNSILSLQIRPYQFVGAALSFALIILYIFRRLNFKPVRLNFLDYGVFTIALFSFFALITAPNRTLSLKQNIILLSFAVLYYLSRNFLRKRADIIKTFAFFVISFISAAIFGLYQVFADKIGKNSFEIMFGRPNSTFTEPDWFGIFLCFALAAFLSAIYFIANNKEMGERVKKLSLVILYFFVFWNSILIILTLSRSAWLGSLAVLFVFLFFSLFRKKSEELRADWHNFILSFIMLAFILLVSISAVTFAKLSKFDIFDRARSTATNEQKITIACDSDSQIPQSVANADDLPSYGCQFINLEDIDYNKSQGKIVTQIFRFDPNVKTRSVIYHESYAVIKNSPILGVGYDTITEKLGRDQRGAGLNESNIFLQAWAGSGLFGVLSLILLLGYLFIYSFRRISPICPLNSMIGCPFLRNDSGRALFLFTVLGLIALVIPNIFNAGLFMGIFWLGLAMVIGIIDIVRPG
jgi:hypothetical protein